MVSPSEIVQSFGAGVFQLDVLLHEAEGLLQENTPFFVVSLQCKLQVSDGHAQSYEGISWKAAVQREISTKRLSVIPTQQMVVAIREHYMAVVVFTVSQSRYKFCGFQHLSLVCDLEEKIPEHIGLGMVNAKLLHFIACLNVIPTVRVKDSFQKA